MPEHLSNTSPNPAPNATSVLPPAVDTHFHVFTAHQAVPGARYVPAYDAPLAQWQALAQASGIGRGVLVQTSFLGTDNSLLQATLAQHPTLLRGVAVVAPDVSADALQSLHASGVRGVRLNLAGRSTDLGAWQGAHTLWESLQALGWHVELHTDVGALPLALPQIPAALPVVVDHMGKPDSASAHDASVATVRQRRSAPVWMKLSGPYRLAGRPAADLARLWLAELGPDQLLWGSDWPFTNHETQAHYPGLRQQLNDWLPAPARQAALHHNPQRLYWADALG